MTRISYARMLHYLHDELALAENTVNAAMDRSGQEFLFLPMVLWEYDLLTLKQVDQIYDWLATACVPQLDWWIKVQTSTPLCTYYFGPFESRLQATYHQEGYIQDLTEEGASEISLEIEKSQPIVLTIF